MLFLLILLFAHVHAQAHVNNDYIYLKKSLMEAQLPDNGSKCASFDECVDFNCEWPRCRGELDKLSRNYTNLASVVKLYRMTSEDILYYTPKRIIKRIEKSGLNKTHIAHLICAIDIFLHRNYISSKIFGSYINSCSDQPSENVKAFY